MPRGSSFMTNIKKNKKNWVPGLPILPKKIFFFHIPMHIFCLLEKGETKEFVAENKRKEKELESNRKDPNFLGRRGPETFLLIFFRENTYGPLLQSSLRLFLRFKLANNT